MKQDTSQEYVSTYKSLHDIQMDIDPSQKAVIMNMLRSQIYSDPLSSLVREVISNALDAHKRAGRQDIPISITLPIGDDRNFIVRDFGNSMTPEVIASVYSKLGSSDKRNSNTEIGGFGIGAASPLSYSNVFYIDTYTNEKGELIHRRWMQYVDDSLMGMISLLKEEPFTNATLIGTAISVPIDPQHLNGLMEAVIKYTQFLKVRPVVNVHLQYRKEIPDYYGVNWEWYNTKDIDSTYCSDYNRATIVIEGIPYLIDRNSLGYSKNKATDLQKLRMVWSRLVLYVDIGSLDLSVNRETLQYTRKTIKEIDQRLEEVLQEIQIIKAADIMKQPNLHKACCAYNKIPAGLKGILKPYTWKGLPLSDKIQLGQGTVIDSYYYEKRSQYHYTTEVVLKKSEESSGSIYCSANSKSAIFINDLTKGTSKKYARYFLDNTDHDRVHIIEYCPNRDDLDFKDLGIRSLQELAETIPPPERRPRTKTSLIDGFVLGKDTYRPRAAGMTCYFETTQVEADTHGCYVTIGDAGEIILGDRVLGSSVYGQIDTLRKIVAILGIDLLYGFKAASLKKLTSSWVPLSKIVKDYLAVKSTQVDLDTLRSYFREEKHLFNLYLNFLTPLIYRRASLDSNSLFLLYYDKSWDADTLINKYKDTAMILDFFYDNDNDGNDSFEITTLRDKVLAKYPLLKALIHLKSYNRALFENDDSLCNSLIHYINLIDSEKPSLENCESKNKRRFDLTMRNLNLLSKNHNGG